MSGNEVYFTLLHNHVKTLGLLAELLNHDPSDLNLLMLDNAVRRTESVLDHLERFGYVK